MGNHDRSRSPRWAGLLLMASTASALTLSNFQLITSSGVPIACILVYNTVIPGCSTADFTQGNTCSSACVSGIGRVQETISDVCDGVNAPATSVLGQAIMGNLVNLLCPAAGTTTSSTSKTTSRSTSTTSSSSSSTTSSTSTSTTSTTQSKSTLTTVVSPTATRTGPGPTDTPSVVPSFVQSEGPAPATTQTTGAQQSVTPPQPTSEVTLGGGSPFDVVATGNSRQLGASLLQACSIALVVGLLLAR